MPEFVGLGRKLNDMDVVEFAEEFNLDQAIVKAVCEVESNGSGFLNDNRPKILFEAHIFYRETNGLYGNNNISSPRWNKNLYGQSGKYQYERLNKAIHLNRKAGLKSASWGLFQILGQNYKLVGFDDVEDFVRYNCQNEKQHLELFGRFCVSNNLISALQNLDWERFVRRYNGPGQVEYYGKKLIAAYEKFSQNENDETDEDEIDDEDQFWLKYGSKGKNVKNLQSMLEIKIDGNFGVMTENRVRKFQIENNLIVDGIVGPITWRKILEVKSNDNG